jgi:hypothetical protein
MPGYLGCTEVQAIELRISQQWLRTMVWQLCVSQGLVSSVAPDSSMTFKYPVEISRDVLSMTHQFSQQAMEVQGVGFVSFLPSFIIPDHPKFFNVLSSFAWTCRFAPWRTFIIPVTLARLFKYPRL